MRKSLTFIVAGVVALGLIAAAGAGPSALGPYKGLETGFPTKVPKFKIVKGAKVTFGYQVVADNEANVAAVKLAKLEAKRLGVKLVILHNHVSADKQVTDFNQLIAQKVDAMSFYPLDQKAVRPSIKKARKAGITLFAQDAMLPGEKPPAGINTTILAGRDTGAYLQVKEMARLKPGGKIVLVGLGFPVAALEYHMERMRFWAKKAGLVVLGRIDNPTDNEAGAEQAMRAALGRFGDVDGVIAYNDGSALGAYAALRAAGKRDVVAIGSNGGSDARAAIERGRLAATVQIDWPGQIVTLLDLAYIKATKQKVKVPRVMLSSMVLVNKDNIDKIPSWEEQIEALEKRVNGK